MKIFGTYVQKRVISQIIILKVFSTKLEINKNTAILPDFFFNSSLSKAAVLVLMYKLCCPNWLVYFYFLIV